MYTMHGASLNIALIFLVEIIVMAKLPWGMAIHLGSRAHEAQRCVWRLVHRLTCLILTAIWALVALSGLRGMVSVREGKGVK